MLWHAIYDVPCAKGQKQSFLCVCKNCHYQGGLGKLLLLLLLLLLLPLQPNAGACETLASVRFFSLWKIH